VETAEQKNIITRKFAVLKSLANKAKKKKSGVNDYIEDKNNKGKDSGIMKFVMELLTVLAGVGAIKDLLTKTITSKMPEIELFIKDFLKQTLKEQISCGVDTPIPTWLINGDLELTLQYMDYTGLYHIDPMSDAGKVLYSDNTTGVNSTDFNTYVHGLTTSPNTFSGWGHNSDLFSNDILDIQFLPTGTNGQNQLNIKPSATYATSKTMTDLNNDYIDSLHLFPTPKIITDIMESIFSPISYSLNFPMNWFKKQEEINRMINKLVLAEKTTEIDDGFFTFTNEEKIAIDTEAYHRSEGTKQMVNCGKLASTLSLKRMTDINNAMATATTPTSTYQELKTTVDESFNSAASDVGQSMSIGDKDKFKFEMEFFSLMFDGLFLVMANILISPKIMMILQLNNKVIYGPTEPEYKTAREALLENKVLYDKLIDLLSTIITSIIIKAVIKELGVLSDIKSADDIAELLKNQSMQLLSLVGIPDLSNLGIIEELGDLL